MHGPFGSPTIPPEIIVRHKSGSCLTRSFSLLGWALAVIFGVMLLSQAGMRADYYDTTGDISEAFHSGDEYGHDKVAIITIEGVIMEGDGFVKQQIDRIRDDEDVRAIVVRVNSPGGTVTGSDYMLHHLKKLRDERKLPVVVSMGSLAASGGYYVSMAVGDAPKTIFAEPTTITGSIGVIIPHYDVTGLMDRFDVKDDSIASHPNKQMLTMTRPLTDEQRALVQAQIDESFEQFKSIIRDGRPVFKKDPEALNQLATGEVFTSTQAKKHGLIDEIGFIEEAIDRAVSLAKLDKEKVRVVKYERLDTLGDLFGVSPTARVRSNEAARFAAILELSSPRAYYLATTLPPLVTTSRAYQPAD